MPRPVDAAAVDAAVVNTARDSRGAGCCRLGKRRCRGAVDAAPAPAKSTAGLKLAGATEAAIAKAKALDLPAWGQGWVRGVGTCKPSCFEVGMCAARLMLDQIDNVR